MKQRTLFGDIAHKMGAHPENWATEGLCYLLTRHSHAWPALQRYLAGSGAVLPEHLSFSTQDWSAKDGAIPDIAGYDSAGTTPLVIEAKFWANLTENQPVVYLSRLPEATPGMLLVVAPALRFGALWGSLADCCETAGIDLAEAPGGGTDFRWASLRTHHRLGLVSWRALLNAMAQTGEVVDDAAFVSDVRQLEGLCELQDSDAFLPLRAADLSPEIGRRVVQFSELVTSVVEELVRKHGASTEGMKTGGSATTYARHFMRNGLGCALQFNPERWARAEMAETPLWLEISKAESKSAWYNPPPEVVDALRTHFAQRPSRLDAAKRPCVAIDLPLGAEKHEVVAAIVKQVLAVAALCASATAAK